MGYYRQPKPWVFTRIVFSTERQMAIVPYVGSLGGARPELNNLHNLYNLNPGEGSGGIPGRELTNLNMLNIGGPQIFKLLNSRGPGSLPGTTRQDLNYSNYIN